MLKPVLDELTTLELNNEKDHKIIKSVTPISMNIMVPRAEDGSYSVLARITWLCKDVSDKLFCLTSTYVAEDESDEEFLVTSPLLADKYFTNYSLTADILMSTLDHYLTDMKFSFKYSQIHKAKNTEISLLAFEKSELSSKEDKLYKIMVTPEVYATLSFVDQYMVEAIYNNADLYSSLVYGADENNNTYIFDTDKVEILDIACIKGKGKYKNLAVKMKISHINDDESSSEDLELMALVALDKGKKILNKEIRKKNINDISKDYMVKDNNQYIQRFMFNNNDHLFIKAVNINKDGVLVSINSEVQDEMVSKINILLNK